MVKNVKFYFWRKHVSPCPLLDPHPRTEAFTTHGVRYNFYLQEDNVKKRLISFVMLTFSSPLVPRIQCNRRASCCTCTS